MLTVGELVGGRYRVMSLLGQGGMAEVYRARDEQTGEDVAVKVLRSRPAMGRWSDREIRALSRLHHPGIVRLRDSGVGGPGAYLVLDLVDGESLAETLQRGALPAGVATELVAIVADGVQHAHDRGIVHRDIKPANILLDRSGRPHLADFGIARLIDATATTAAGFVMGTASYLAPEQVRADRVGPPADVYALGLVLLECLTGERAFPGTFNEAAAAHLARDPAIPPSVAPWLAAVVRAATTQEPAARPSAARLAVALRTPPGPADGVTAPMAAAAVTRPLAVPVPHQGRPGGPPTEVMPMAAPVGRSRSSRVSRRAWFGAIGVGAVVGVAGALVATERGSGGEPPVATIPTTTVVTTAPTTAPTTVPTTLPAARTAPTAAARPPAPTPAKPKKGNGHGQGDG
jgi:hypothetical protein